MSELSRARYNVRRITRRTGIALGTLLLATGCSTNFQYESNEDQGDILPSDVAGASPSPSHTPPRQPEGLPEHVVYDPDFPFAQSSYCFWRFGTRPVPLSNVSPVRVRVDNRCTAEGRIDTHFDKDIPVYKQPMDSGDTVTDIVNGNEVTLECYREGTMASNLTDRSDIWLKVSSELFTGKGWLADITLGGGFSIGQLEGLGVEHCPAPAQAK